MRTSVPGNAGYGVPTDVTSTWRGSHQAGPTFYWKVANVAHLRLSIL